MSDADTESGPDEVRFLAARLYHHPTGSNDELSWCLFVYTAHRRASLCHGSAGWGDWVPDRIRAAFGVGRMETVHTVDCVEVYWVQPAAAAATRSPLEEGDGCDDTDGID